MKLEIKRKVKKQFTIYCFILTLSFLVPLIGCEKEELLYTENLEFLEVDTSIENYSENQLSILKTAKNRFDECVSLRNGKFHVNIKSGYEIGISEELFLLFLNKLKSTNYMIDNNYYKIVGENLKLNTPELEPIRLKSGSEDEGLTYSLGSEGWEVQVELNWYGADISVDDNYVHTAMGGAAIGLIWCPEPLATKILGTVAGIGATTYEIWGGNGITIHIRPWGTSFTYN